MKKLLTLCIVQKDDAVLLGMKKRGFGAGRWNGFGGKVENGETLEMAAIRELQEETGIVAKDCTKRGILTFTFDTTDDELEVHVFVTRDYTGEPIESEEMRPAWFMHDKIPFDLMWSDDKYWFPYLLAGESFVGSFHFDSPANADHPATILSHTLSTVKDVN